MRFAALAVLLAACGGPQRSSSGSGTGDGAVANTSPPVTDTRTPIEQRRDAACDRLGPRLTACAVEDAHADLASGKVSQAQFAQDTAPSIQQQNTAAFEKVCKATAYSSRQVRVLEVCPRDETRCSRLLDCLGHLSDAPAHPAS